MRFLHLQNVAPAAMERRSNLVVGEVLEKGRGGGEEQAAGDGAAEIEQAIVVAGRASDEHIFKHLLDGGGRAAIADEIGSEFTVGGAAEGHVVAQNLDLSSVFDNGGEGAVGGGGLDRVVQLDIGQFPAADDSLLRLGGQSIPCGK